MEIKELIEQCKKNDRVAQKELFMRFKDTLFVTSLKYCRNEVEAEDNLHDTFVTIFRKIKTFKGNGSFEGWMQRIAINQAITKFKSKKQLINTPDQEHYEHTAEIAKEDLNVPLGAILKAIQELPDQYRMVFNLYQLDNFSHKEISKKLSISEGTSKSNLHRAKIILRDKISQLKKNK
ncbi:MAG: RNA polymerase sigma factor [Aureisphaera sp.]